MRYNNGRSKDGVVDYQRARVYKWCHEIEKFYPKTLDEISVTLLLERVKLVTGHEVQFQVNGRARSWAWGGKLITMPHNKRGQWAWTVPVVLHEASHVILKNNRICDKHGPRFVGLFLQLLKNCGGSIATANIKDWALAAIDAGVQMDSMAYLVEQNVPSLAAYGKE